jgi:NTP pyrophosphatase (non-canonical NTP hydrolase)
MTGHTARESLESLRDAQRAFVAEREWECFHTPKNLAAALAVEAAELLEPFQWLTAEESARLSPEQLVAVRAVEGQRPQIRRTLIRREL